LIMSVLPISWCSSAKFKRTRVCASMKPSILHKANLRISNMHRSNRIHET
jgi:hypothetical protein